jgi:dihydroorotate dehydrogenase
MLYERLARPVLFRIGRGDPEAAHERTLGALGALARRPRLAALARRFGGPRAPRRVFGIDFPGPVGLAGGLDKRGVALPAWPALGFGFVEVGTVTRWPQPGNERPRLFRLPASQAVINRMGFNNDGADALADRLAAWGYGDATARSSGDRVPLGISLGKSKATPLADAVADYVGSLRALHPYGDYFAVNVSSPNTPGLRSLQDGAALRELLGALRAETAKPLLVKIAPDLTKEAIDEVLAVCAEHRLDGVIATNTTLSREGVAAVDLATAREGGGLSGAPLTAAALEVVRFVSQQTGGALPIVGVGGILRADDAERMFDAGASLVQVYTGLLYRGPGLVRAINRRARAETPR